MNKYTVMLLLPESMTDGKKETYLTHVEAASPAFAEKKAKEEAAAKFDGAPWDFEALAVLDGWVSDISETYSATKEDERECKLCLIERVSEFAYENVESYRNDTTGVAADLAYLLWAIAADTTFLWGREKPDGIIMLMLEHDQELLKELLERGYIVKEMLPNNYQPDPKRHMAEIAAVVACAITDDLIKLGNEGMITHYSTIADIALECDRVYPVDYDWEEHMDKGGDCWDIEVCGIVEDWLENNQEMVGTWD